MQFAVFALVFYFGARFVRDGHTTIGDLLAAMFTLIWSAFGAGAAASNSSDMAQAEPAKRSIFALIDRQKALDPFSHEGLDMSQIELPGSVEFRNVTFAYPSRPNDPVLVDVSFTIRAGSVNVITGTSGCGKSTLVKLLAKQYIP